ncbi:MAG: hypothetical protein CM1200mP22_29800 [Dehalococcoidia bacterium]|nr:MAG: hypothetical protein CM1200mP22_29800 [Dehalococcoidia bacterium]
MNTLLYWSISTSIQKGGSSLILAPRPRSYNIAGAKGPRGLTIGGQNMEGLIFGGHYMAALRTGRVPELIETFENAARQSGKDTNPPRLQRSRYLCLVMESLPGNS